MKYCESVSSSKRRPTREVMVGNIGVGGENPVRIQSMTTSNTRDAPATIEQIIRLADSGCEIARVTVQGMKEADACEQIKDGLLKRGYTIPLVADIHFYPPAAMRVVDFVDKVRINPGNFVDKRATFKILEYDDQSYQAELEKIEEKFSPLVEKCKRLKRAMRIGTNHGSLSDRIMNRYGDTPQGMVESAVEFAKVCIKNHYHDFMFSMKSSNPKVMIQAYRLLMAKMYELGWDYPLHLGVTEAGLGEDGRIKSAMGIGALLLEGIGDTIRVSLTEDPWHEIEPCRKLVKYAKSYQGKGVEPFIEQHRQIADIKRRSITVAKNLAWHRDGVVFTTISAELLDQPNVFAILGCKEQLGQPTLKVDTTDQIFLKGLPQTPAAHQKLNKLQEIGIGIASEHFLPGAIRTFSLHEWKQERQKCSMTERFSINIHSSPEQIALTIKNESLEEWKEIKKINPSFIFLSPDDNRLFYCRHFFEWLQQENLPIPVILNFQYACSKEDLIIEASAEMGALLCDGLGDGICLSGPYEPDFLRTLSFNILQAARMRTVKTDFISCPSCGRTLFDLQDVTKRIRSRTAHLPGVKIAIMGCIVNGPGEMADADFGYVGSKPGKIDLYVGKDCVERDIDFADADDRLIDLIKTHGRWIEPQEVCV